MNVWQKNLGWLGHAIESYTAWSGNYNSIWNGKTEPWLNTPKYKERYANGILGTIRY